jgi:hypothetical protein
MYWFKHVKKAIDPEVPKKTVIEYIVIKVLGTAAFIVGIYHLVGARLSWITQGNGLEQYQKALYDPNEIGLTIGGVGVLSWFLATSILHEPFFIYYDDEDRDDRGKHWIVIKAQLILLSYCLLVAFGYGVILSLIEGAY